MTQDWIHKTLIDLGFEPLEAEIYVYLVLNGPQRVSAITAALGINRQQIYLALRKMEKRKIIFGSPNFPTIFSALSFDKVLDLLAQTNLHEAKRIEQKKMQILRVWFSYFKKGKDDRNIKN